MATIADVATRETRADPVTSSRQTPGASAPGVPLSAIVADDLAFRAWYERTAPRVYAYLMSRCGSDELAEELLQAVFVEVLRRPDTYDGRTDVVPWLIGIARHRLARHYRELARAGHWARDASIRPIDVATHEAAGHDAGWQAADLQGRIRYALEAIPVLQRAALVLRFMDDLSVREVARHLHRGEDATESLLRRARDRFEREFRGDDDAN
jgi:RNA polymerase sigma-70 factor (ECF subfamily)